MTKQGVPTLFGNKVKGSWGRRLLAMAGEVTWHGWAHPYSRLITIVSLGSKESEESHRSKWKIELLSMFLAITCQHASGACRSHSRPVLNLREASRKYIELFSQYSAVSDTPILWERSDADSESTPNLRPILPPLVHIWYSLRSGIFFQSPQGHSGDWVSRMIL